MDSDVPRLPFSYACLRVCLILDSIVFWVQGSVFLLLGTFIHNFLRYFFVDGKGLKDAGGFPIASIILGIAMVIIGLLINFIIIFPTKMRYFGLSFMLIAVFVFEIIYFIAGFEYAQTIERVLKEGFQTAMINYNDGFIINTELNFLQSMLGCCGAKDFMDWYETRWAEGRMQVPESCCINVKNCHNLEPVMVDDIYQKGCNGRITATIKSQNIMLITAVTCVALTQILGIVLTVSLGIKEIDKEATISARPLAMQQPETTESGTTESITTEPATTE